jgi:4-diphosphocytidyl-2-C-methyl-D-erythritol kinase
VTTLRAPAKVNLTLEVIRRRPDGYHDIRSVVLLLPHLADTVQVHVADGPTDVTISTRSAEIPVDNTNICHRATVRFLAHINKTARVTIDIAKRIPVAAGLGGGSSDAAAALLALNRHFGERVSPRRLAAIGADVGKDVPVFLYGAEISHVSGTGERVRAIGASPAMHLLIVNPRIAIATKDAYAALRNELWFMDAPARTDRSRQMLTALDSNDLSAVAATLYNDFELVADRAHPVLKEIRQSLRAFGAAGALMSGSGSTLFGTFASLRTLNAARKVLSARYPDFFVERG